MRVPLADIAFDAGTQVRAAINEQVVTDYAERMTDGVEFPPIVLFHDGNAHYLADGFHRYMAAQRNQFRDIEADVRAGTKEDALWFALGANKVNGQRMTEADKTHAVALALRQWPEKMQREIAEQIGCSESLVSKVFQSADFRMNTSGEPEIRGRALRTQGKLERVRELVSEGKGTVAIAKELRVTPSTVTQVRAQMGKATDNTRESIQYRRDRMREMAAEGYTTRQIAADLSISTETVNRIAKAEGIDIHADRVVPKQLKKHDANRIVSQMVMDADNLCADVNLIDFSQLDPTQLGTWIHSLNNARKSLNAFIRRLEQEQKKHGEAA
jgi:hypothetical protein